MHFRAGCFVGGGGDGVSGGEKKQTEKPETQKW